MKLVWKPSSRDDNTGNADHSEAEKYYFTRKLNRINKLKKLSEELDFTVFGIDSKMKSRLVGHQRR